MLYVKSCWNNEMRAVATKIQVVTQLILLISSMRV